MIKKQYYCDNPSCRFHTPFSGGSAEATAFLEALGLPADHRIEECVFCSCDGLVLTADADVPSLGPQRAAAPIDRPEQPASELYGALIFCADLSGSMLSKNPGQAETRYDAVVRGLARLLRDLAGQGQGYASGSRRPHYDHLLFSFVRFARNTSIFHLSGHGEWFTLQMLATAHRWSHDDEGFFRAEDIEHTCRQHLIPMIDAKRGIQAVVQGDETDLAGALRQASALAQQVAAARPGAPGFPANFAGLGRIPRFPDRKKLYLALYSDGRVNAQGKLDAEKALDEAVRTSPDLLRLTVFFGSQEDERASHGGQLLRALASPCFSAAHANWLPAYFSPEQAHDLHKVLRMVTVTQLGICPVCMALSEGARG